MKNMLLLVFYHSLSLVCLFPYRGLYWKIYCKVIDFNFLAKLAHVLTCTHYLINNQCLKVTSQINQPWLHCDVPIVTNQLFLTLFRYQLKCRLVMLHPVVWLDKLLSTKINSWLENKSLVISYLA